MGALVLGFALWIRYSDKPVPPAPVQAKAPPVAQEVTQLIDAVSLVGKSKKEAEKTLGAPSSCSPLPVRGEECSFAGNVTILFARGRADWVTLSPRPGVDGLDAIKLVGVDGEEARLDFYEDSLLAGAPKIREIFYPRVRGAKGASVSVYRDGSAGLVVVYGLSLDPRLRGLGGE